MKNKTAYLLGILLAILLGTYLNYLYCCQGTDDVEEVTAPIPLVEPTKNAFTVTDVNGLSVDESENFNFNLSGSSIRMPLADRIKSAVDTVSVYFKRYPSRAINITGYYKNNEINSTAFPNLGLARANAVKNYFVRSGVPSRHVNTFGLLDDSFEPDANNILYGPVSFKVVALSDEEALNEEMEAIAAEIKGKPLMLYFETGAATLTLTPEQREKVAKIARYLDKVDESTCLIVGHTDNTGTAEGNMVLGQERADYARNYLINNHIRASKVTSLSKGQTDPIASNDTAEGRAQNRRIEVTIN